MLIEKGLALDIIREGAGMFAHVLNIMVLVLIPMVIIHVNGNAFSLSELSERRTTITGNELTKLYYLFIFHFMFIFSRCNDRLLPLFGPIYEALELYTSKYVV